MITFKVIESYKDYGRVLEIQNGVIKAAITIDIGPRIIFFGFCGGQNIMCDNRKLLGGKTDKSYQNLFGTGKKWENLGGHRIWAAPEEWPFTYTPDDSPVTYTQTKDGAVFTSDASENAGFKKTLEIKMDSNDANMQVKMKIKNISGVTRDYAIWALTVSTTSGTLILPMNNDDTGLLPNRTISVWPYTDIKDSRYTLSDKYAVIKNTPEESPMKLGFNLKRGNAYYFVGGDVFRKEFNSLHGEEEYVDGGCSFETYNCGNFIEIETLSPIKRIAPQGEIEHTEAWSLYKCENPDLSNDDAIDKTLKKL